ncbi:hypothetical protein PsYK624_135460 [Phanerochaete sordida]|uniref:Uncharacterized protein n=1 Tax=Phanerochaete sordida TaxID=48140 RepID=A0A9P3LJF5_9APHY|nr:hypothetical protein PsYK624_135460 [Phanerochaete sordida]
MVAALAVMHRAGSSQGRSLAYVARQKRKTLRALDQLELQLAAARGLSGTVRRWGTRRGPREAAAGRSP